jgi:hypothetical protein
MMLMEVNMDFDSRGQLLSLDLLLYMVVLSVVVATALYVYESFDNSASEMLLNDLNDERMNTLVDALFKTPGQPENWHVLDSGRVSSVGLCVDGNSYLISYDKLMRLKGSPGLIYTVFPSEFKCNVYLTSSENPSQKIDIVHSYTPSANDDVIVRSLPVIIDYGYDILPITSDNYGYDCPYNHLNRDDDWMCKSFTFSRDNLSDMNYYIVSSDADIILSDTYGENESLHSTGHVDITDKLKLLVHHDEDTIYIHLHSTNDDAYLVSDRNNRPQHLNNVVSPETYTATIEVST